jgi:hypothetical protein
MKNDRVVMRVKVMAMSRPIILPAVELHVSAEERSPNSHHGVEKIGATVGIGSAG